MIIKKYDTKLASYVAKVSAKKRRKLSLVPRQRERVIGVVKMVIGLVLVKVKVAQVSTLL